MSRTDIDGCDLPPAAMTARAVVEDIVAALDAEGITKANIYGSSYGSYVAQAIGAWFPDRVSGMILDSAMDGADQFREVRENARDLLWEGNSSTTATAARLLREVVDTGQAEVGAASEVAQIAYEFAGIETLERLLRGFRARRATRTWKWLAGLGANDTNRISPYIMEFDLVGRIAFRELNYAGEPDGGPFDTASHFRGLGERFGGFEAEPLALSSFRADFTWPVVVLSGERDLRTPRVGAQRIADSVPRGLLVAIPDSGHSALDTHGRVALAAIAAVSDGSYIALRGRSAEMAALPKLGASRHIATLVNAGIHAESILARATFWR
ncbi:alpha/beta fold hydrolase [Gordonia sinesedis]